MSLFIQSTHSFDKENVFENILETLKWPNTSFDSIWVEFIIYRSLLVTSNSKLIVKKHW